MFSLLPNHGLGTKLWPVSVDYSGGTFHLLRQSWRTDSLPLTLISLSPSRGSRRPMFMFCNVKRELFNVLNYNILPLQMFSHPQEVVHP